MRGDGVSGGTALALGRRLIGAPEWPPAAATALGLLAMIEVVLRSDGAGAALSTELLLGLCGTVPLGFVRMNVLAAAVPIVAAATLTMVSHQWLTGAVLASVLVALYLAGRQHRWPAPLLLALPFVAYPIGAPFRAEADHPLFAVALAALAVTSAGLGAARRARAEATRRAASSRTVADTLLEHAARGERARIARELHDVVAHHISMIAVQAETARLTTPGMPAEGARRLLAIGDTARAALTEMRRLLGVLREDAGTEPTRQPQPGLLQLMELVDEARDSAGASTRLIVRGPVARLDPGIELTAYRIVQEALTNARRHAPGAAVDVEIDYTVDALHLRIRDNGPGPENTVASGGHGLLGMRERAAAVGGDLRTGPAPVGGFLVEARLPAARLGASGAAE